MTLEPRAAQCAHRIVARKVETHLILAARAKANSLTGGVLVDAGRLSLPRESRGTWALPSPRCRGTFGMQSSWHPARCTRGHSLRWVASRPRHSVREEPRHHRQRALRLDPLKGLPGFVPREGVPGGALLGCCTTVVPPSGVAGWRGYESLALHSHSQQRLALAQHQRPQ